MDFGAIKTINLAAATTLAARSNNFGVKGYTTLLLDFDMTGTALIAFEVAGEGGTFKNILGTFVDGTAASSSIASTSKLARFNVTGMDAFRVNIASISIGTVTANATAFAGGTAVTT